MNHDQSTRGLRLVRADGPNPWTKLDLPDDGTHFSSVLVSDRTAAPALATLKGDLRSRTCWRLPCTRDRPVSEICAKSPYLLGGFICERSAAPRGRWLGDGGCTDCA
jgi:hypothetical protein